MPILVIISICNATQLMFVRFIFDATQFIQLWSEMVLEDYKLLEGADIRFIQQFNKLPPESQKKVYEFVEMVNTIEKEERKKKYGSKEE